MCFTIKLLRDSTFLRVKGILKFVLCRLFFFLSLLAVSAFFLKSHKFDISSSSYPSFLSEPISYSLFSMSWENTYRSLFKICFTLGIFNIYYLYVRNFGSELCLAIFWTSGFVLIESLLVVCG